MKILSAESITKELQEIAQQYPAITKLQLEGYSEGLRPIYSITVGCGKQALICTAGVHGRECINPSVLVKMAKSYCEMYTKVQFLSQFRILMIPLLNPDGYEIAQHGYGLLTGREYKEQAELLGIPAEQWRYNSRCVDINRNFPCQSYQKQRMQDQPLSEAESRILVSVFQREDSIGYLDFHSRGKEIYWYRAAMDEAYNKRQRRIAEAFQRSCGYHVGTPEDEMPEAGSGGNTVQYYAEQYFLPAITIETIDEDAVFPLDEMWLDATYHEIRELPLVYLRLWRANLQ